MKISFENINPEEYFLLAGNYFSNLEIEDLDEKFLENSTLVNHSVGLLIFHPIISELPCIEITIRIIKQEEVIGNYLLYVTLEKEFIEEFLIFK